MTGPASNTSQASSVAGLIAVVGCDGTGKSTLTHGLVERLRVQGPVERRYLGLVSGETGDKIKRLPVIGVWLERRLAAKAAHAQHMKNKLPNVWGALVMYGLSVWRAAHLRKVQRLAESGVLVITDRYPQAEVAGFRYDGPGLGLERSTSWLVGKLARREQRLYERMTTRLPALIIRLDIDIDTSYARKPDHSFDELRDKIEVMARLRFNGARIVDIDARAPLAEVLENALRAITHVYPTPRSAEEPAA